MASGQVTLFLFFSCGFYILALGNETFRGDKVIRLIPTNLQQLEFLRSLENQDTYSQLDFWQHPSHIGGQVDIHVPAISYAELAKLLTSRGIQYTILQSDLQAVVDKEKQEIETSERSARAGFNYAQYNRLDQINAELQKLAGQYTQHAKLFSLGKSYENRNMYAMKISSGKGKKTYFINCGIHAREWVTQATCMFMIKEMLSKYGKDRAVTAMIDKMDWIIMPVLNVDGYVYTHTRDRMWRKTRKRNSDGTYGTDPNRNWNYGWAGVGASPSPGSQTYYGSRAFSEVESRNVAHWLYMNRRNLVGYMDIHAYSQLWMTPWGYTKAYPKDYTEMKTIVNCADMRTWLVQLKRVADIAVRALTNAGYRTQYKAGPSSVIIYKNSGGTKDWTYGVLGLTYSYALELRDKGRYGFFLPANQIIPTGTETFAAIKAMAAAITL